MVFREYGHKSRQVVAFRSEVIVDHVDQYGDAAVVSGLDESAQAGGATVGAGYGEGGDYVVAPVAVAGSLGEGH